MNVTLVEPPGTRAASRAATATSIRRRHRRRGLLYVLPALLVFGTFVILPALHTVYLSFFHWDGITPATVAGLDNYRAVLAEPLLRDSLGHAFLLVVFFSLLPIALGLLIVAVAGPRQPRGTAAFRMVLFLPQVLPLVAVGIIWRWMYAGDGTVNQVLGGLGLGRRDTAWLGDPDWALVAVGLVGTWVMFGLCMTLFFAGAQRIDPDLYDAALVDGAGRYRQFRAVTFPGLRRQLRVALTVTIVAALASFDIVYVTTNGAPANMTTVPGLLVYRLAFTDGEIGTAAALAVVLTVLVLGVVLAVGRYAREDV